MTNHRLLWPAVTLVGLSLLISSFWLRAQRNDSQALASLAPPGALIYLEAKDFRSLVVQWNTSEERRRWLRSGNFSILSESRLVQRLAQAQVQFASVVGLPVEMNLLDEVAGTRSALAVYDLANLELVYLTRLDNARLEQSDLWKGRSKYQSRQVAGLSFYTKTETLDGTVRTVSLASHDGWLIVATSSDLMARTLSLFAHQPAPALASEAWFKDTIKGAGEAGDLRLVYNLAALRTTPQFRTYWIQRNNTELKAFSSGTADVIERPNGFEERRTLLRVLPAAQPADVSSLARALSYVPPGVSLYRAWATPDRDTVKSVFGQVVLSEAPEAQDLGRFAPQVNADAPITGTTADLETRINEPQYARQAQNNLDEVTNAIMAMRPMALLHNQTTQLINDRVFVLPRSEAAIVCLKPDRAALEKSLASSIALGKTGSLDPLRITLTGNVLLLSRLDPHEPVKPPALAADAVYAAGYNHVSEWPRYGRLFRVIDRNAMSPEMAEPNKAPPFFSANVKSLGDSLARLQGASIVTQDQGAITREVVRYEFRTK